MLSFARRHLAHDLRRALTVVLATAFAVTSFLVLAGTAERERLGVADTVNANFRGPYDLLVRHPEALLPLETTKDMFSTSSAVSTYGGITSAQLDQIRAIAGVDVAAPVAMLGTVHSDLVIPIDVTDLFPDGTERVLLRYRSVSTARQGHLQLPGAWGFTYLTRSHLKRVSDPKDPQGSFEVIDGRNVNPCAIFEPPKSGKKPSQESILTGQNDTCMGAGLSSDSPVPPPGMEPGRYYVALYSPGFAQTVAAIDPVAEAALVGIDDAVVAGRFFADGETTRQGADELGVHPQVPALMAVGTGDVDYSVDVTIEALDGPAAQTWIQGFASQEARSAAVDGAPVTATKRHTISAADLYDISLRRAPLQPDLAKAGRFDAVVARDWMRSRPVNFDVDTGTGDLVAIPVTQPKDQVLLAPSTVLDGGVRIIDKVSLSEAASLVPVGRYDPAAVDHGASSLGVVPLELYANPVLSPADESTRAIVGEAYRPDYNPLDYAQRAPTVLVPLSELAHLDPHSEAPITSIRVRVAGIEGPDDLSRERLRAVAEEIQLRTGLRVDVAAGASLTKQTIVLPATKQLPALRVAEDWTKKGVAVTIVRATDQKSVALFSLILVAALTAVGIVAAATAGARRQELATLATVGWRPGTIIGELCLEFAVLGLLAGVVGTVLSLPLSAAASVEWSAVRAALALPTAVLLCVLASLPSAVRASRISPAAVLRDQPAPGRGLRVGCGGPVSLGVALALARPARLLLSILLAAMGVFALTTILAIQRLFQGRITGTVLGEAVTVQVSREDVLGASALAVMALSTLAIVINLGLREDSRTYATLTAIGWSWPRIGTVVVIQGLIIGLLGAALGAGVGLAAVSRLAHDVQPAIPQTTLIAAFTILAAGIVALLSAAALRRLPLPRVLSRH